MNESECLEYAQGLLDATTSSERSAARKELRAAIRSAIDAERTAEREACILDCEGEMKLAKKRRCIAPLIRLSVRAGRLVNIKLWSNIHGGYRNARTN